MFLAPNLKKPKENQCFCLIIALAVLLAILGTILAQNGPLGGPLGDLGHNLERHSLYIHKLPINRKAADTCNPFRDLLRPDHRRYMACPNTRKGLFKWPFKGRNAPTLKPGGRNAEL